MIRRLALLAVSAALTLAACTSTVTETAPPGTGTLTPTATAPGSGSETAPSSPIATAGNPQQASDPGKVTGTLAGRHCAFTGTIPYQLPDPSCTPGAYDPHITAALLCARDAKGRFTYDTSTYRPPVYQTSRFKLEQALPAYALPDGTRAELDHLIPLYLGGANSASNLWPQQPAEGKPVAPNIKDATELALHTWVCSAPAGAEQDGRLASARQEIARDWITALDVLGVPHKDIPATARQSAVALAA